MSAPAPCPGPRLGIEIHERQQVQIELAYPMLPDRATSYTLDLFLFVPPNVGISSQNYRREDFYRDTRAYLRADSPPLTLFQLADLTCTESPLHHLDQALQELERDLYARPRLPIVVQARLFGLAFRESVSRARQDLVRRIDQLCALAPAERQGPREALIAALSALGRSGYVALLRFRQLRRRFEPLAGARPESVKEVFAHVDEYATSHLIEQMEQVAAYLRDQPALYDGSGVMLAGLLALARSSEHLARERQQEGFAFPDPDDPRTAEYFTYRRRLIRRSLEQAFYLETRALRRDPFLRNAIAMVAAGLAAVWSLVAQVPAKLHGLSNQAQLLVLAAAVIAYMLKDRIKELTKERLVQRLWQHDHDNLILGDSLVQAGLRGVRGRARERMRWLSPGEVPGPVVRLRTHPRTVAGSDISTEEVIGYQRTLLAGPGPGQRLLPGFALRDIIRLNLNQFMVRLDEPMDQVGYYDLRRRRYVRVKTPKVYHLNLLIRVQGGPGPPREPLLSRYRVVLNRERILRIEPVVRATGQSAG